jgi:hypothetical protein
MRGTELRIWESAVFAFAAVVVASWFVVVMSTFVQSSFGTASV